MLEKLFQYLMYILLYHFANIENVLAEISKSNIVERLWKNY